MRCPAVQQKLDLYIREELAPSVRARIEAHLSGCDQCRQVFRRLRRLEELVISVPLPPVPEGFAQRVVSLAQHKARPARRAPFIERPGRERFGHRLRTVAATAAALAAGLLLGGYLGFDTWRSDDRVAAVSAADPLAGSGLGQLVEPGGDSLAQSYLALISGADG